ncbi:hypothetical protein A9404_11390 [Halothiobacillus diazotrophicus]|uniref:Roadblock/LAMTOR2 domain-containing protein n=1 Tax=Halothiobacillus diazotrophicus TaxID=1860122 RepID=A0A191ZJ33_9GAMM|nr:DUF2173 family protein [Halothiobacillus diazotrophicus]ANJ67899.1 hypothetical protein A9404_11390 [Halothiobacillus diazotrophicus]
MHYIGKLAEMPGVIAAGSFTYKGEVIKYVGQLSQKEAQQLSSLCVANLRTVRMQGNMLQALTAYKPGNDRCGLHSAKGWVVHGAQTTVCVVSDSFCILKNRDGSLNEVLHFMLNEKRNAKDNLI